MSLIRGFVSEIKKRIEKGTEEDNNGALSTFWLQKPLHIKIDSYIEHILYQLNSFENLLIITYLLIENILPKLNSHNIHRILFASLAISHKFLADTPFSNSELEKIGGVKPRSLLKLELALLELTGLDIDHLRSNEIEQFLLHEDLTDFQIEENNGDEEEEDNEENISESLETNDTFTDLIFISESENYSLS